MLHAWAPVVSSGMITIGSMLTLRAPGEVSVDNVDTTSFMLTPWALCWHRELPVRTDENWQRKHRPGPGTGHWPSQGHCAVCGVVWAEFLRNHGQKMFRIQGLPPLLPNMPSLPRLGSEIRNYKLFRFEPLPTATHHHSTQQPFTRAHWRMSSATYH